MLHNCLDQAVINGYLPRNPLQGVKLPQVTKKEMIILTQEEQNALHMAAQESHTAAAFGIVFTLSAGIRMGEMLGLQWGNLDYSNHSVKIRRTVGRLQKVDASGRLISKTAGVPTTEIVARSPKSVIARRTIPLFPQVWNDPMIYHQKQQELLRARYFLNANYSHILYTFRYLSATHNTSKQAAPILPRRWYQNWCQMKFQYILFHYKSHESKEKPRQKPWFLCLWATKKIFSAVLRMNSNSHIPLQY